MNEKQKEKQKAQGIKTVIDQITHENDHGPCISANSLQPFTPNAEPSHQSRTPGPEKSVLTVSFFFGVPNLFSMVTDGDMGDIHGTTFSS